MSEKKYTKSGEINMTTEQVEDHLRGLSSSQGKIGYLSQVLRKPELLSQDTRGNVYRILANEYIANGQALRAAETFLRVGGEKEKARALEIIRALPSIEGGVMLENAGLLDEAVKIYRANTTDSDQDIARRASMKVALIKEEQGDFYSAAYYLDASSSTGISLDVAQLYEKAFTKQDGLGTREKLLALEKAKKLYEQLGNGVKVARLARLEEGFDRSSSKDLTSKLPVTIAVIGLVGGAFCLSSNVTGNVIGLSDSTSSWIGGVLILIGLIALGLWVKSRKGKKSISKKVVSRKKK